MEWDDGLESPHLEIASSTALRIGILAGPGTGKTGLGLMRRVARLLADGVRGERILLLSFTRVAARDLRDKVAGLNVSGVEAVMATTLHAYCFRLLHRQAVLTITHRVPRILLAHETDLMLRDIGGDFGDIRQRRERLRAFEAGWARRAEDHPGLADLPQDRAFEAAVLQWLREHRAMLIGEVVPIAYEYLSQNPAADELGAFDHVIVDEYQDLNALEQHLLEVLTERDGVSLCIAGDDDQSIYRMRFANREGILGFVAREDTESYEIWTCLRCPQRVLSMANSLISYAPGRAKPDLKGANPDEGAVAIVQWDDLDEEINGVVAAIAADVASERRAPGDILVLTHRRLIGERIREGLRERGILAESYFTEEELREDQAQEALAMLRLAVFPEDAPALRVILGVGDADGRTAAYRRLLDFGRQQGASPKDVLANLGAGEKLAVSVPALVARFTRAQKIVLQLDLDNLEGIVEKLFPEEVAEVSGLRRIAVAALPECKDAADLLDRVVTGVTQEDVPQHPDFVRIMSLHKSKGLTSPSVFVAGMVDGIVPTLNPRLEPAEAEPAIEEQRRLFFVAITRAAEQLTISHARRMDLATARAFGAVVAPNTIRRSGEGHTCGMIASRYLRELGPTAPRAVRGIDWIARY
jgi:DNA helicase II / ATP-dependent DNA helicase PcrA